MVNDGRTLVDPAVVAAPPPVQGNDEGTLIAGRYRLLRPLGSGGMGTVYLAEDRLLARQVAIKTIRPELSANEEVRARIKRECRHHAAIGVHPHIVTLYDSIEEHGHLSLVMEYFAGETLAARLAAQAASSGIAPLVAVDIVRQVLRALEAIHGAGIVHRDIKTANILLQHGVDGGVLAKLTDFGIARTALEDEALTRLTALDGQGPGTPAYMAPERIDPQRFGAMGPASDLYAVGVILFELLTGHPPFTGTMTEIFSGHLMQPPDWERLPATLPEQCRLLLHTALAKQAEERFASATALLIAVEELAALLPQTQPSLPAPVEQIAPAAERTLLAAPPQETGAGQTLFHPRLVRRAASRRVAAQRWWWGGGIAAVVAVLVLLLVWSSHRPRKLAATGTAPATVAASAPPAQVAAPQEQPLPPNTPSALETVENVRQQKSVEAAAVADRSAPAAAAWQVVEDHSRKLR